MQYKNSNDPKVDEARSEVSTSRKWSTTKKKWTWKNTSDKIKEKKQTIIGAVAKWWESLSYLPDRKYINVEVANKMKPLKYLELVEQIRVQGSKTGCRLTVVSYEGFAPKSF